VPRRLSLVLVTLLALSSLALSSIPVSPAATETQSGSSATQAKKLTITIISRTRTYTQYDLKPKGKQNKGDWFRYRALLLTTGPLFGKKHKNVPVGWEAGTQTYVNPVDARIKGTATFPGQGTIKFRGLMRSLKNGMISVPVVGGTGKFKNAKGVLLIGAGDIQSVNTYRLTIPEPGSI